MTNERTRHLLGALTTAPAAVIIGSTASGWRDQLPDPLPTHWSGRLPDGFTGYGGFTTALLVVAALATATAATLALLPQVRGAVSRGATTTAGAVAWGACGIWLFTARVSWDVADPATVRLSGWLALALLLAGVGALVAWLAHGRSTEPVQPPQPGAEQPTMVITPGERVVWRSPVVASGIAFFAIIPAAAGAVVIAAGAPLAIGVLVIVSSLPMLALGACRVVVDEDGLTLRVALGLPVKRIPLDRVVRATVEQIQPMEWGGWGYRVMPGRSALVLRAGPAVVVDLGDGRRFAATVDDAATGAAVINGLLARDGNAS